MCTKHKTQTREIGKHDCNVSMWAKSNSDGKLNYIRVGCKRWSCKTCRPKLVAMWAEHFNKKTAGFASVYHVSCDSRDWPKLRKRLWRAEVRYFTVKASDSLVAVYYEFPMEFDGESCMSQGKASRQFRADVEGNRCTEKNPVTTCREWKLDERESRYTFVGFSKTSKTSELTRAANVVEQRGHRVRVKLWAADLSSGAQIEGSDEAVAAFLRELREHKCCAAMWKRPSILGSNLKPEREIVPRSSSVVV